MQNNNYRVVAKIIGAILTLASLYYLFSSFREHFESIVASFKQPIFVFVFIVGILLYLLTFFIIILSWHIQLHRKYPNIYISKLFRIVGISQIGKYLPGNIFHLAGRFYLAKKAGINSQDITNSLIFETIMVIVSALLVGSIYFNYYVFPSLKFNVDIYWLVFLIFASILTFYILDVKQSIVDLLSGYRAILIVIIFMISHLVLGSVLYLIEHYLISGDASLLILTSMLALAFVVGYITPGSPGGIGIREFVFIKLAVFEMDESSALSLILSLRLITISGDLLIYLIALKLKNDFKIKVT